VRLEELVAAVAEIVPLKAEANQAAAREAFEAIAHPVVKG
jgi:hypothetical protein